MLFTYHWLQKAENDYWDRFGRHLGTVWNVKELVELKNNINQKSKERIQTDTIFVPLSIVMNPELPSALLGNENQADVKKVNTNVKNISNNGDELRTEMPLPRDADIVNMANLEKEEFFGLIANAGLSKLNK